MFRLECEAAMLMMEKSPQCYMVSGKNGEIYWTNRAFELWSKYTIGELQHLGWNKLSQADDNLEADEQNLKRCLAGEISYYVVRKKFIPKHDKGEWGDLVVVKYPSEGETEFFICEWIPLKNGTAAAFNLAIESINNLTQSFNQINEYIQTNTEKPNSRIVVESIHDWCVEHPKSALTALGIFFGMIGVNNSISIIQKISEIFK